VIDISAKLETYRLIMMPDDIPVDAALAERLAAYVAAGGSIIASGRSGFDVGGRMMLPAGIRRAGEAVQYDPSYMRVSRAFDPGLPKSPFVMYGVAETVSAAEAEVLAEVIPPYFNRSHRRFSSHRNTPDDPKASPLGPAVTVHGRTAYVAYPIFSMYQAVGQPLYKYVLRGLMSRLLPNPVLSNNLPSAARATLTLQVDRGRHILHLLYGAPQVRGKRIREDGRERIMEMIEDIPALGPVSARVRLPKAPSRAYEALTGAEVAWRDRGDGTVEVSLPGLHIHAAIVLEGTV